MGKKHEQPHSYNADIEVVMQIQPRPPQYVHSPPQESWFPWIVPLIFMIDVGMFVYTMYINNCPSTNATNEKCLFSASLGRFSFQPMSQNPLLGPSINTLTRLGALGWQQVVKKGETWRLLSCIWLHAGVIHLAANMMSLLFVGIRLEQEFGFSRIGPLFVLSGFGGSLLSSIHLKSELTMSVGASGALFGLLGAMLSELITNWTLYANKCAALMTLIFVILLNLGVSILPHVDSSAHIGGFLSGFLLGFILLMRPQFGWVSRKYMPPGYDMSYAKSKYKIYQYFLCATALVLLATGYAYGLATLFNVHTISNRQY